MGFQAIFWKFPLDFLGKLVYPNRRLEKTNDSPVRGRIESEENTMMPLVLADTGEELTIQRIGGSAEVKRHLENLGFVAGGTVMVITALNGNVIVKVKEARVAISEEMARKIMV